MDLMTIIKEANPNVVILLMTTFIAFISWLVKSLIEKPLNESKKTFANYFEKRIEVLTEVKTLLNFIAYFPEGKESLDYKIQLQTLLLKNGKIVYLSKEIYDNVLIIGIDPVTNEILLLKTIKKIDEELYIKISKIQEEISFYRRFSSYSPFKRFVGILFLTIQYAISLILVIAFIFSITTILLFNIIIIKILVILMLVLVFIVINKWLNR